MLKPYSPDAEDGVKCPPQRPEANGLHIPIKQIVRGLAGDLWRVNLSGDIEITISLIDCFAPPLFVVDKTNPELLRINPPGRNCYDSAWDVFSKATQLSVLLPIPAIDRGWMRSLNGDAQLPGWIWLTDRHTINSYLVRKGLASRTPNSRAETQSPQQVRDRAA
jgi:hypothetical protein